MTLEQEIYLDLLELYCFDLEIELAAEKFRPTWTPQPVQPQPYQPQPYPWPNYYTVTCEPATN